MPTQRLIHHFFLGIDLKRYYTDDCQSARLERNGKAIFRAVTPIFDQPYSLPSKLGMELDFTAILFSSCR